MDAAHTAQRRGTFFLTAGSTLPTGMSVRQHAEEKAHVRARLVALRRALLPEDVRARGACLQARLLGTPQYRAAQTVALYAALPGEVPTDILFATALADRKRVVFPSVPAQGELLTFRFVEHAAQLTPSGRLGIREPVEARPAVPLATIGLFVVPGLGFSRAGQRLGRGAGYYDATLALAPSTTPRIGLAFSEQLLDAIPSDEKDVPMHWVLTEDATYAAPGAAAIVVGA